MKNLLMVLALFTAFTFAINAQSKDCCSKEKGETTKLEKCTDTTHQTMKSGGQVETTTKTVKDGKEIIEKEIVMTKVGKKENCGEKSSCCDMKKEMKTEKVEKEVEKKQ